MLSNFDLQPAERNKKGQKYLFHYWKKKKKKKRKKMGKSTIMFIASAICLFSLLGITQATEEADNYQFVLTGMVYCDPCRAAFKTNLSEPIAGIFY